MDTHIDTKAKTWARGHALTDWIIPNPTVAVWHVHAVTRASGCAPGVTREREDQQQSHIGEHETTRSCTTARLRITRTPPLTGSSLCHPPEQEMHAVRATELGHARWGRSVKTQRAQLARGHGVRAATARVCRIVLRATSPRSAPRPSHSEHTWDTPHPGQGSGQENYSPGPRRR